MMYLQNLSLLLFVAAHGYDLLEGLGIDEGRDHLPEGTEEEGGIHKYENAQPFREVVLCNKQTGGDQFMQIALFTY